MKEKLSNLLASDTEHQGLLRFCLIAMLVGVVFLLLACLLVGVFLLTGRTWQPAVYISVGLGVLSGTLILVGVIAYALATRHSNK